MVSASTPSANEPASQGPHFSPHSTAKKPTLKAHFSGRSRLKKLMKMIINNEKIPRNDSFQRAPETDFRHETKARKVMVDFKFDALYR